MRASPDDILGMTFFAHVVEARSFSDAARALGMSKSAVSARVARLEDRLGVRLLHRTTRRLALTADGVRLYELCARILEQADAAAELAAGASDVPRGTLRIHAPSGFGQAYLAAPIGEFMRMHPAVRVELHLSDRVPDATLDGVDLAVVVAGRLTDSGLTVRKLATARVTTCAAPSYLRRKGIPFRPHDLVNHDCLSHSVRQGTEDLRFQTDEGTISMASLSNLIVDDTRFLRDAALSGLGIAMLPELLVADDVAKGHLYRVLDDFQTIELGVHVLHAHGRLPPASVRAFVDHLGTCFREPPWERARPRKDTVAPAPSPKPKGRRIPMTEQDVRRLTAVAAVYSEVDAKGSDMLRSAVARAKTMPASTMPRDSITMNSIVRARDEAGNERELTVVYPWDAHGRDRVSVLSPLGLALLGASVQEKVTDAKRTWTIRSIPYQPEAAGDHHL